MTFQFQMDSLSEGNQGLARELQLIHYPGDGRLMGGGGSCPSCVSRSRSRNCGQWRKAREGDTLR